MRFIRTKAVIATAGLALSLAACGDAGNDEASGGGSDVEAASDCDGKFEDGSRMAELADAGKINVGVRFDQPGLGFKGGTDDMPSGFDVEMAKLLVADLCIDPNDTDAVNYEETISDNREPYLETGRVDLVAASYSITDERRALVGQAGPYFITGQQVLVKSDSDVESIDDLKGEEVCSASGSTSLENVNKAGAVGVPADTYSICAEQVSDGSVPAMSTDGSILLGLAAQYDGELKVVGDEFSEERIGIGYSPDAPEMCQWISDVLQKSFDDGTWAESFESTLGASGSDTPEPPELDACA
ncbi:transporter substrate-binding domain-containing protein [Nocardioides hwasunensis]|uniref:Transporter substrate-binding domain-containing protein n=1 Tax=Nocardioides hwasunensis TaxID=397258 RepID=A0ABR8MHI1_9ACTN|nr:transporter substrate-binding domain-containing protein [Nocardioides hwasunensis]MBD3915378.1 transporter substrate-binding domain-containing protein [Nocardioides hwasunensis]